VTALILNKGPSARLPAQAASQAFPQQHFGNGVLAVRHWTLSGHAGSVLTDTVTITNPTGTAQVITYDEPIPAAIAPSLSTVRFTPGARVVDARRAAQWKLRVPARGRAVDLSAVTWKSSDTAVATVNQFGEVTAISAGTTHVTASIGSISAFAEVIVTIAPTPNPGTNYGSSTYTSTSTAPGPGPSTTPPPTSSPSPTPTVTPTTLPADIAYRDA